MNRRALLTISLVAFFGLGVPLCAFACLENMSAAPVAVAENDSAEAPCHGGPASPTEDVPSRDHDCDCDSFDVLLSKAETNKAKATPELVEPAPFVVSRAVPASETVRVRFWKRRQDLPPADLLLLKSTLLI